MCGFYGLLISQKFEDSFFEEFKKNFNLRILLK